MLSTIHLQYRLVAVFILPFLLGFASARADVIETSRLLRSVDDWACFGTWSIADGVLSQADASGQRYAFYRGDAFGDVTMDVSFRVQSEGDGVQAAGMILRSSDSENAVFVHFDTRNDQVIVFRRDMWLPESEIARKTNVPLEPDKWYRATVEAAGEEIHVSIDGTRVLSATDGSNRAGLCGVYTSQGAVDFKDMRIDAQPRALPSPWKEASSHACDVPRDQAIAEILDVKVLARDRYVGWPSVACGKDGELMAVYSGDRDAHVCEKGKVRLIRSADGGKTWTKPETVIDLPIDDRDSGIIQTKTGAWLVTWFTGPPYFTELQGDYATRSTDGGKTWSKPINTYVSAPHGPIQLKDGRLLYIGQRPHCSHVQPHNYNGPPKDSPYQVSLAESADDGKTWRVLCDFPVPEDAMMLSFDEPHLVETADGTIVAMFRDCNPPDQLWQSESRDGGKTWSKPWRTPLQGHPPHLLRLEDDTLVVVYARRRPPFSECACISRDGGKTWDVENEVLLARGFSGDIGYPGSAQLPDGSIWTVYYQAARPGEHPSLMGTHWRLKDAGR